jgi:hypothetical protein
MDQYGEQAYMCAPELLLENHLGYPQFPVQRSKTPGSLYNHTGLTPTPSGPISTPQSRDNSQPPPEQPFVQPLEQMNNWDDAPDGSYSTSPTSVRTPDENTFDQDMPDAAFRDFYHGTQPSQSFQDLDMTDIPFLDEQVANAAFIASTYSVSQQVNAGFDVTTQPPSDAMVQLTAQPYNQHYGTAYTRQPPDQDPWNQQIPLRNPEEPPSGIAVFAPESDPNWSYHMQQWTSNHTDPSILISPSDPTARPLDDQFNNYFGQTMGTAPMMETSLSQASSYNGNFESFNFNQPAPYISEPVMPTHPTLTTFPSATVSITSTSAQAPLSPYQGDISPLHSAPSPLSEGISSHCSDHGSHEESHPSSDQTILPPPSPVQIKTRMSMESSPEIEEAFGSEPAKRRQSSKASLSTRPGGRTVGTHLEPKVAKAAHDMRKIVACWHCVLQRDKCGPGDVCVRCVKRAQRPNADTGLGCSRVKLIELTTYFLPSLYTSMHEDAQLTHFVSQHIRQWGNVEITVLMTAGQFGLPRIPVKVYEFLPKTNELTQQIQYRTNPATQKRYAIPKASPPLGMVHINHNEEKKYDKYINDIVDHYLDTFTHLCWGEDTNDFQEKLFRLLIRIKPRNDEEGKLLREVYRLVVVTYIMGRTITIAEEDKDAALSKLHSYQGAGTYMENFCSPRMTNRQLKYFFHRIHQSVLAAVLNKLQQIFKSSKGCDKWLVAFFAVLGLAMSFEDQQKTIHLIMETKAKSGECTAEAGQSKAEFACRAIDNKFTFIAQIFRWKYNRKCNPLRDNEMEWDKEVGFRDQGSVLFVRQVASLVKENIDYLSDRQRVSISGANQTMYTSRLVSQFLLSFWLPSG